MSDLRPTAPLVFTPTARRLLALLLVQAEDERVMPASPGDDAATILGMLSDLGLAEIASGGYIATDHLRSQAWAPRLADNPFPD